MVRSELAPNLLMSWSASFSPAHAKRTDVVEVGFEDSLQVLCAEEALVVSGQREIALSAGHAERLQLLDDVVDGEVFVVDRADQVREVDLHVEGELGSDLDAGLVFEVYGLVGLAVIERNDLLRESVEVHLAEASAHDGEGVVDALPGKLRVELADEPLHIVRNDEGLALEVQVLEEVVRLEEPLRHQRLPRDLDLLVALVGAHHQLVDQEALLSAQIHRRIL